MKYIHLTLLALALVLSVSSMADPGVNAPLADKQAYILYKINE